MDRFKGLRIGMQSFTLRKFDLPQAMDIVADLGLKHFEVGTFGGTAVLHDQPERAQMLLDLAKQKGVMIEEYMAKFPEEPDAEKCRVVFEFAVNTLKVRNISTSPRSPETLEVLDKLAEEYGVTVAIHNHGPSDPLRSVETIKAILDPHSERIGLCVDTGHYLRLPLDPIEVMKAFKPRIHAVHLRDMDPDKDPIKGDGSQYVEHIVGEGPLNLKGVLNLLLEWDYKGNVGLEYKPNMDNPVPDIRKALENIEKTLAEV